MRIAFVDHLPVGTGIIRYATKLAFHLVRCEPEINLVFFTHYQNYKNNSELFDNAYETIVLKSTKPKTFLSRVIGRLFCLSNPRKEIRTELLSISGFDVVYFTSAHMSPYFEMEGRRFATIHDFNWKYSFGLPNFEKKMVNTLNDSMPKWLQSTRPIVSSHFMKEELLKFYPEFADSIEVVYLPNIANSNRLASKVPLLPFKYILYPANFASHKNHLNLFRAFYQLKLRGKLNDIRLVLTGNGTDHFKFAKLCEHGIQLSTEDDYDVLGLGYVNNDTMDSLIQHALVNISASLYEAASGPAIDAWINKSPFMMSDIPSHRDQLEFYRLKCLLFDPFNPDDIANKIGFALRNLEGMQKESANGYEALCKYNWEHAASEYLRIFKS